MSDPLASLAIFLGVAAVCWWALVKAYRTDEIYYRGDTWHRSKNPILFWMVVGLCIIFGVIAPVTFVAKEGPEIMQSVQGRFE